MTIFSPTSRSASSQLLAIYSAMLAVGLGTNLSAQDPAFAAAAQVDGTPILVSQLRQELKSITDKLTLTPEAHQRIAEKLLEQVIQRRLVLGYLRRSGQSASAEDIAVAVEQLRLRLKLEEKSLELYLKEKQLDQQQLETQIAWQLSWPRFQSKYLTDDNLQRYFEKHREQFDGTERKVAHILLKSNEEVDDKQLIARQQSLRLQIVAGDFTFAEAARDHSESPSAEKGGEIGWINWNGPMPGSFTTAAFSAAPGTVSAPVQTRFGVHLVQCLEIKPGKLGWQDAREPLRNAVVRYLFSWAADQQRERVEITRSGLWPEKENR
jgi:parvulin-like peptidyl-prolyl isomerase